tara:strand:+ start:246 stop:410 length:165 start_codon:yes stop_codon:yes gene_type:complete
MRNNASEVKTKKCNKKLDSIFGVGLSASVSAVDAYSWSIPLVLVLGRGIGKSDC